jgi:16S rRNA (guanine527-N7)-methyltransferase
MGLADRVRAIPIRAETLARDAGQRGRWPAVTARAVASLPDLVELGLPFLRPGGLLLAWKSGDPDDPDGLGGELRAAEQTLGAVGDGRISVGEPVSAIVAGAAGRPGGARADPRSPAGPRRARPPADRRWLAARAGGAQAPALVAAGGMRQPGTTPRR